MKYYSDLTKKFYDTEEAAMTAEKKHKEAMEAKDAEAAQRKADSDKVKDALKKVEDAIKDYNKELKAFNEKYPSGYHTTIRRSIFDYLDDLFPGFFW